MTSTRNATAANDRRIVQVEQIWAGLLREALQRGFFGSAAIELSVSDGAIQHVRRKVDRIEQWHAGRKDLPAAAAAD